MRDRNTSELLFSAPLLSVLETITPRKQAKPYKTPLILAWCRKDYLEVGRSHKFTTPAGAAKKLPKAHHCQGKEAVVRGGDKFQKRSVFRRVQFFFPNG